jgi:transposase
METTITMTASEQRRAWVMTRVLKGEGTMAAAAEALGLSERQLWRLRMAFERAGPAGLVHGNRGRRSGRRLDESLRQRIVELARERYAGTNDCHLADLLAEREAITVSRPSLQRILRAAGLPAKRRRRAPRHHSRRARMAAEGTLLQLDGSRHAWLEQRAPQLTLLAAIDDATGKVIAALFREQ